MTVPEISFGEVFGYAAAVVTFATYSMKTMIPLRISGIVANILFITFGYLDGIYPTLVLHAILLPVNSVRLYQMLQLVQRVREAAQGDLDMNWLKPFMSSRQARSGETLFRKGEPASQMFFVVSGKFRLLESGIHLGPGTIVGELGLLAPDLARTQTLECLESGSMLYATYDQMRQLYFQNPKFGFFLLRLIGRRLFQNIAKLEAELTARPAVQAQS